MALLADLPALRRVSGDHGMTVVLVPVAKRLGFRLLNVEAKRAQHSERCDGKKSGTHSVFSSVRKPSFLSKVEMAV